MENRNQMRIFFLFTSLQIVPSVPWIFSQLTRFRFECAAAPPGRAGGGGGGIGIPP